MRETFSVPEVSCGHCKSSIEGALRPLSGVTEANVRIESKQVDVAWEPQEATREDVVRAIESVGYEVAV